MIPFWKGLKEGQWGWGVSEMSEAVSYGLGKSRWGVTGGMFGKEPGEVKCMDSQDGRFGASFERMT